MKRMIKSFGFSLSGLWHAISHERNIQLFLYGHGLLILIAGYFRLFTREEALIITIFAMGFLITELINTSIERLADTVDDHEKKRNAGHFHVGIQQTKDVSAAASLIALTLEVIIIVYILVTSSRFMT
jgi:diacylglycerol kinase